LPPPCAVASREGATDRNAVALTGLRIAVGLLFLIFGQYKVFGTQFESIPFLVEIRVGPQ